MCSEVRVAGPGICSPHEAQRPQHTCLGSPSPTWDRGACDPSLCNLPPALEAMRGCSAFRDASFQGCGLCGGVCRLFELPPEPPLLQPVIALRRVREATSASV